MERKEKVTRPPPARNTRSPNTDRELEAPPRARCPSVPSHRPAVNPAKPVAHSPLTVKGRSLQPSASDALFGRVVSVAAAPSQGPRPKRRMDLSSAAPNTAAAGERGSVAGPGPPLQAPSALAPPPPSRQVSNICGEHRLPASRLLTDAGQHTAHRASAAPRSQPAAAANSGAVQAAAYGDPPKPSRFVPASVPYHQRLHGLLEGVTRKVGQGNVQPPPLPAPQPPRGTVQRQQLQGRPQQPPRQRTPPQDAAAGAAAAPPAVPEAPLVQGQAMELRRPPSREERPPPGFSEAGGGSWGSQQQQPHGGPGAGHQEEYWEWLLKSPPTPESPHGSDMLRALIATISPKFAVRRPEGYVPRTPSSISSSRYVRSDVWHWSCPETPAPGSGGGSGSAVGGGGSSAASTGFLPLHSPQVRHGPASPEPLHRKLLRAAAAAAGLLSSKSPTRCGASSSISEHSDAGQRGAEGAAGASRASSVGGCRSGGGDTRVASPGASLLGAASSSLGPAEAGGLRSSGSGSSHGDRPPAVDLNLGVHHYHHRRHQHHLQEHSDHLGYSEGEGEQRAPQQPAAEHSNAELCHGSGGALLGGEPGPGHRQQAPAPGEPRQPQHTPPQPPPQTTPGKSRFFRQQQQQQQQKQLELETVGTAREEDVQWRQTATALPTLAFGGSETQSVSPLPAFGVRLGRRTSASGGAEAAAGAPFHSGGGAPDTAAQTPRWISPGIGDTRVGAGAGARPRAHSHVTFASPGQDIYTQSHGPCVWKPGPGPAIRPIMVSPDGGRSHPHGRAAAGCQPQPSPPAARGGSPGTVGRTPPARLPLLWEPPPLRPKPRIGSRVRRSGERTRQRQPDFGRVSDSGTAAGGSSGSATPRASDDAPPRHGSAALPPLTPGSSAKAAAPAVRRSWVHSEAFSPDADPQGQRLPTLGDPGNRCRAADGSSQVHVASVTAPLSPASPRPLADPRDSANTRRGTPTAGERAQRGETQAGRSSSSRCIAPGSGIKGTLTLRAAARAPRLWSAAAAEAGHTPKLLSVMLGAGSPDPAGPANLRTCRLSDTGGGRASATAQTTASSAFSFHMRQAEDAAAGGAQATAPTGRAATPALCRPAAATTAAPVHSASPVPAAAPWVRPAPAHAAGAAAGDLRPHRRRWALPTADAVASSAKAPRALLFAVPEAANEGASGSDSAGSTAESSLGGRGGANAGSSCRRYGSSRPGSTQRAAPAAGLQEGARVARPVAAKATAETTASPAGTTLREAVQGSSSDCGRGPLSGGGVGGSGAAHGGALSSSGESWGSSMARDRTLYRPLYRPPAASQAAHEWPRTGGRMCGTVNGGASDGVSILVSCNVEREADAPIHGARPDAPRNSGRHGAQHQDAHHAGPTAGAAGPSAVPDVARDSRGAWAKGGAEQGAEGVRRNLLASFGHASGPSAFSAGGAGSKPSSPRASSRRQAAWPEDTESHGRDAPKPACGPSQGRAQRRQWDRPGSGAQAAADVAPAQDQGCGPHDVAAGLAPQPPAEPREGAAPRRRGSCAQAASPTAALGAGGRSGASRSAHAGLASSPVQQQPDGRWHKPPRSSVLNSPDLGPPKGRAPTPAAAGSTAGGSPF